MLMFVNIIPRPRGLFRLPILAGYIGSRAHDAPRGTFTVPEKRVEGRVAVISVIFCLRGRHVLGVDPLSGFLGLQAKVGPVEMMLLTS